MKQHLKDPVKLVEIALIHETKVKQHKEDYKDIQKRLSKIRAHTNDLPEDLHEHQDMLEHEIVEMEETLEDMKQITEDLLSTTWSHAKELYENQELREWAKENSLYYTHINDHPHDQSFV